MSEPQAPPNAAEPASTAPKPDANPPKPPSKPIKPQNPVFKMMGIPRMKLPSRNWTIFLTVSTSLAAAIIYDKRETKRAQRKWCKLVEHLRLEPIYDNRAESRKLRIFLEAPPGDGLRIAQDHFKEYVKPVLVASGVDWEFVQGRKEGDIRAAVAERIRKERRGEALDEDDKAGQNDETKFLGTKGDIVIGRHTWKEYVRGLHEGWLGPVEAPAPPQVADSNPGENPEPSETIETLPGITIHGSTSESETPKPETPAEEKDKPTEKPPPTPAYILPSEYTSASLPSTIPSEFDPAYPSPFPHILGFLNTPTRFQRFLNRRRLADSIGRDVAAIILSTNNRPFTTSGESSFIADDQSPVSSSDPPVDGNETVKAEKSEVSEALVHEERDWLKSVFKTPPPPKTDSATTATLEPEPEKTWISPITTDPRIASRMRKSELSPEDEVRAKEIVVPEEEIEGFVKGGLRWLWRWGMGRVDGGERERNEEIYRRNKMLGESEDL